MRMSKKDIDKFAKQIGVQISHHRVSDSPVGHGLRIAPVVSIGNSTKIGILGEHSTYRTLN